MRLDSVRELKTLLTETVINPMTAAGAASKAFTFSAGPIEKTTGVIPSIALGVARRTETDFRLAVRYQRSELEHSKELEAITKRAKGEVDLRFIGRVGKRAGGSERPWHQRRHRKLKLGTSIGHFAITAGTLGAVVKRRADGVELLLSNNHVLANENKGKVGDAILQPGVADGGTNPADHVASLEPFTRLKKTGSNRVDCACGKPSAGIGYDSRTLHRLGKLSGIGSEFLDEGTEVAKVGRTTGLTRGRVTAFELDNVIVQFDIGFLRFDDQFEVEGAGDDPFSRGGDSGSLVVDADLRAVGLLFAGGEVGGENGQGLTFVNPIRSVLDALKVDLVF